MSRYPGPGRADDLGFIPWFSEKGLMASLPGLRSGSLLTALGKVGHPFP